MPINKNASILNTVFRTAKMGSDNIDALMPKINDPALRRDIACCGEQYKQLAMQSAGALSASGQLPQEIGALEKLGVWSSIKLSTMGNLKPTQIAEMMINGTAMGIIELQRELNAAPEADGPARELAAALITLEETSLSRMKSYL